MDLHAEHNGYALTFFEEPHRYVMSKVDDPAGADVDLESVTQFLGRFFEKFDAEKVGARYAAKRGLDKDEVIAGWKREGDDASDHGHRVHKFAEDTFNGDPVSSTVTEKELAYRYSVLKAVEILEKRFKFIEAEKIVFDPVTQKAGTIDLVLEDLSNSDIFFLDWKTNKKIEKANKWRKALPPIEQYDDCNFIKYSLQLNTYERIARANDYYHGRNIRKGLAHLTADGVVWYKVGDMQDDVRRMLEHG